MNIPVYDLPADVEWPGGVDPNKWRQMPDPDPGEDDDDENQPTPQYVIDILGFDPDEL